MLDSYRDLIEGLTETPSELRAALGNPVPDDLDAEALALLVELRTREAVQLGRVQQAMRDRGTHFRAIEREPALVAATEDAERAAGSERPEGLLSAFNSERSELIALLMNLTLRDWERPINHEGAGETSLGDEIENHLSWDEQMLNRVRGLAANEGLKT